VAEARGLDEIEGRTWYIVAVAMTTVRMEGLQVMLQWLFKKVDNVHRKMPGLKMVQKSISVVMNCMFFN